jgi:hypothetical protein
VLQSFIERYEDTIYAELARAQKRDLEARQKMVSIGLEMEAKRLEWAEKRAREEQEEKRAEERKKEQEARPETDGPSLLERLFGGRTGLSTSQVRLCREGRGCNAAYIAGSGTADGQMQWRRSAGWFRAPLPETWFRRGIQGLP